MNIRVQINRAIIATDAFFRGLRKNVCKSKEIYIVFQQIFGDSIVIQNSLAEYTKLYPTSEGYHIHFLARSSVLSFMQATLPLPEDIIFETVDFKRFLEDYGYYRKIVKKYTDKAGTIIVPGTSLSAEIFSCANNAERKIGLVRSIDVTRPWIMAYFYRKAYKETVRPDKEDMMLQRHRKLIHYLGNKGYKARLPHLLKKEKITKGHYAVMCLGSSKREKCWPIERFAVVADYVVKEYGLRIHLCGGNGEEMFAEQLMEKLKGTGVVNHIGKTSFSDWAAIVQHADLAVGNDSATMHLAVAAGVPSVCIAGVYDKYQFFPYKVDVEGERLPLTVFKDMPCKWCRTVGYNAGFGNEQCKKRIEAGLCSTCIDLITVDEVKKAIDSLMKEQET